MRIGELSKATQLSCSRIRYYESKGLIRAARRANGYREYSADAAMLLNLITHAQRAGFTLDEIKALLPADEPSRWRRDHLLFHLNGKIADLDAQLQRMAGSRQVLQWLVQQVQSKPDDLQCAEYAQAVMAGLIDIRVPAETESPAVQP